MPTETLAPAPSRLNKAGHLLYDNRPFAEAVNAAISTFWAKYGALPVSVYCGEPIPEGYEANVARVWYDDTVGVHCYWLEFPERMDGRVASG